MSLVPAIRGRFVLRGTNANPSIIPTAEYKKLYGLFPDADIDLLISDITEPAGFQFSHVMTQADFPSNIIGFSLDTSSFFAFICPQIENISDPSGVRTLNVKAFINAVEVGSRTGISINGGNFGRCRFAEMSSNESLIQVGDTIQLKIWGNVTNDFILRNVAVWVIAQKMTVTAITLTPAIDNIAEPTIDDFSPTGWESTSLSISINNDGSGSWANFDAITVSGGTILTVENVGTQITNDNSDTISFPSYRGFGFYSMVK